MQEPWQNPPAYNDYFNASVILGGLGGAQIPTADNAVQGIEQSVLTFGPFSSAVPLNCYWTSDDTILIAFTGSANTLQWVLNVMGSVSSHVEGIPGNVNTYFGNTAIQISQAIGGDIMPKLPSRKLVCIGHSLGGALAQLVCGIYAPFAGRGALCITFGCPRVGDPTYAAGVSFPLHRVEDVGDPVVAVPPEQWVGTGTPWGPFNPLAYGKYKHAGTPHSLDSMGNLSRGESSSTLQDFVKQASQLSLPDHDIQEYRRRLSSQQATIPPPLDTIDQDGIEESNVYLDTLFTQFFGGGGNMLYQGTTYFKTSEEVAGWSESVYGTTDISTMLALLQAGATVRAQSLATSCSIFAFRAANVDPARTANQSQILRIDNPISGTADLSSTDPAGRTNETMDAIDYMLLSSAQSSRRVYPFRGVPDSWIQQSVRSPAGIAGSARIENYLQFLKNQSLGFRVKQNTQPIRPIQQIANDPVSGNIIVTDPGYTLTDKSIIIVRRYTPNPMLNGRWHVKTIDANTFFLANSGKFRTSSMGAGSYQVFNPVPDTIQSWFFNMISTRRTGRPFGSRRGKRSPKLLHH